VTSSSPARKAKGKSKKAKGKRAALSNKCDFQGIEEEIKYFLDYFPSTI